MQALINYLLPLYSLQDPLPLHPVDPGTPLREALDLLELKIAEKDAVVLQQALPSIMADGALLVHVFHNLIGNALKFVKGRSGVRI
ncbi:hypothetical protein [Flaviaesturariibacter amylovorans]|uniref:HAMP domain-containing histidine kinase n=1 Tax=Flaviaesturariibacter amylovorans TaxID=1084520 RepID=A0ABP8H5J7_9BACT